MLQRDQQAVFLFPEKRFCRQVVSWHKNNQWWGNCCFLVDKAGLEVVKKQFIVSNHFVCLLIAWLFCI